MLMAGALKAAVHAAWKGETRPVEETLREVRGKAGEAAIGAWLMFLLDLNPQEALAALDRKEEALREAERAVAVMPVSRDALSGSFVAIDRARVEARVGEMGAAIGHIEELLAIPGAISPALLRIDPNWAPLRGDARFRQLAGL